MKKATAITLVLLIGTNFAIASDHAHQHRHFLQHVKENKYQHDLPRGFESLNLSQAQKAKIHAIVQADRQTAQKTPRDIEQQREQLKNKMNHRRQQERQLLNSKNFNEQTARQIIAERQQERLLLQENHAEKELRMLKKRHAIFQVLTPQQQKQYQEMQEQKRHYSPKAKP